MIKSYVPPAESYIEPVNDWSSQPGKESNFSSDLLNHMSSNTLI